MKKFKTFAILLAAIICLSAVSIPSGSAQLTSGIKVLSYSTYINSAGDFIAVGEIQNQGNFTYRSVALDAGVYSADGTELTSYSSAMAYVNYLTPQEKAPFYIDFGSPNETGTGVSLASSVSYLNFTVSSAPLTNDKEYQDLSVTSDYNGTLNGAFVVIGLVRNNGNDTANNIRVVGTYYNGAGTVVAVGFNNVTNALTSDNGTAFTVSEFDISPTLVNQISGYSLIVDTTTLEGGGSSTTGGTNTAWNRWWIFARHILLCNNNRDCSGRNRSRPRFSYVQKAQSSSARHRLRLLRPNHKVLEPIFGLAFGATTVAWKAQLYASNFRIFS